MTDIILKTFEPVNAVVKNFYGSTKRQGGSCSIFTNNAIYNNGKPLQLNTYYSLHQSNKFHNPENPTEKNTHNGIYLHHSSGGQGVTANWNHTEVPYVLDEWLHVIPEDGSPFLAIYFFFLYFIIILQVISKQRIRFNE